jgi:hypothetical protein
MPQSPATKSEWLRRNAMRKCSAEGCHRLRRPAHAWCPPHSRRNRIYGHPNGRHIDRKELHSYRKAAAAFLNVYAATPQVAAALKLCEEWLAKDGYSLPGTQVHTHLDRLKREGVTALDVLEAVGAVFFVSYFRRKSLPDDVRLTFAIGHCVLFIYPMPCIPYGTQGKTRGPKIGGKLREAFGSFFRQSLSTFWGNALAKIEAEHQRTVALNLTLAKPFE